MDYDDRVSIKKSSTELDPDILECMKCSKCGSYIDLEVKESVIIALENNKEGYLVLRIVECPKCETLPKYETHKEVKKMLELHICLKLPVMGLMNPENYDKFEKMGYPISIAGEIGDCYFIKMGSKKLEKCEVDYYDKTGITPQERMIKNRRCFHEENTEKEED